MRFVLPTRATFFAVALTALCLTNQASAQAKLEISADEKSALDLINQERKKEGLAPFSPSTKLFAAARSHARNMAAKKMMVHDLDGKGVSQRVNDAGYQWWGVGENITTRSSPAEAVASWMSSKAGHRETILAPKYIHPLSGNNPAPFDEAGLGVARDTNGVPYWCLVVAEGRAAVENPAVTVSGKPTTTDVVTKPKDVTKPKETIKDKGTRLAIAKGMTMKGELTAKSQFIDKLQKYCTVYDMTLAKGETVTIELEGSFDTFLVLNDDRDLPVASNDDIANDNLNSRIVFTAPRNGTYYAIVSSYGQRITGTYTLKVR